MREEHAMRKGATDKMLTNDDSWKVRGKSQCEQRERRDKSMKRSIQEAQHPTNWSAIQIGPQK